MCAVCASLAPTAASTAHGLIVMGAVAGSAAVGSIAGFVRRPGREATEPPSSTEQLAGADDE